MKLSADEWERIVTWIDANALFYGTFNPEDQARQLRGERIAGPELRIIDDTTDAWDNPTLYISPVALGCWPLAGITSGAMTDDEAVAVIDAALDAGVNHLDTAYAYGRHGESERRIARAIRGRRDAVVLATKVGVYWDERRHACDEPAGPNCCAGTFEESLRRLEVDDVDLLYLHAPADDAPLADSAGLFRDLLAEGKTRAVGVSNLSVDQMETFAAECPFAACQVRYNRLQREIEADVLPWCRDHNVSVVAYEPLALGLLTGKFTRDHVFAEDDWRRRSPLFCRRSVDEEPRRGRAAAPDRRSAAAAPWRNWPLPGRSRSRVSRRPSAAPSGPSRFAKRPRPCSWSSHFRKRKDVPQNS